MTAQKMSAQEIIAFIGNAEKKTNVKVTFEGNWQQLFLLLLPSLAMFCSVTGKISSPFLPT